MFALKIKTGVLTLCHLVPHVSVMTLDRPRTFIMFLNLVLEILVVFWFVL